MPCRPGPRSIIWSQPVVGHQITQVNDVHAPGPRCHMMQPWSGRRWSAPDRGHCLCDASRPPTTAAGRGHHPTRQYRWDESPIHLYKSRAKPATLGVKQLQWSIRMDGRRGKLHIFVDCVRLDACGNKTPAACPTGHGFAKWGPGHMARPIACGKPSAGRMTCQQLQVRSLKTLKPSRFAWPGFASVRTKEWWLRSSRPRK